MDDAWTGSDREAEPGKRPHWDRGATERRLEEAAMELLGTHGILAGLNLREVADRAGVNRGLIYQYFGSRRELIQAALRRDVRQRLDAITSLAHLPFRARALGLLRTVLHQEDAVKLLTLLVLDGDETVAVLPLRATVVGNLERDRQAGEIPADTNATHVYAFIASFIYGYTIYRERMALELGEELSELDAHLEALFIRALTGVVSAPEQTV